MKKNYLLLFILLLPALCRSSTLALTKFVVENQYLQNGKILLSQPSNIIQFDVTVTRGFVSGSLESPVSFSVKLIYRPGSGASDIDLSAYQTITETDFSGAATASKTYSATITSDKTAGNVFLVYTYYDYANGIQSGTLSSATSYATYNPGSGGTTPPIVNNVINITTGFNTFVNFKIGDAGAITGGDHTNYTIIWEYSGNPAFSGIGAQAAPAVNTGTAVHQFDNRGLYGSVYSASDYSFDAFVNPNQQYVVPPYPTATPISSTILYIRRRVLSGSQTSYSNVVQISTPVSSPTNSTYSFSAYNITAAKKVANPNYHHPLGDNFIDIGIQSPKPGVTYLISYASFTGTQGTGFGATHQFSIISSMTPVKAVLATDLIYLTIDKTVLPNIAKYLFFASSEGFEFHSSLNTF